jgi:hypothetical protein
LSLRFVEVSDSEQFHLSVVSKEYINSTRGVCLLSKC